MKFTPEEYAKMEGLNDEIFMVQKASENAHLVETFRKSLEDNGVPEEHANTMAFNSTFVKPLDFSTPVEIKKSSIEAMAMYIALTWMAFTEQHYSQDIATKMCMLLF